MRQRRARITQLESAGGEQPLVACPSVLVGRDGWREEPPGRTRGGGMTAQRQSTNRESGVNIRRPGYRPHLVDDRGMLRKLQLRRRDVSRMRRSSAMGVRRLRYVVSAVESVDRNRMVVDPWSISAARDEGFDGPAAPWGSQPRQSAMELSCKRFGASGKPAAGRRARKPGRSREPCLTCRRNFLADHTSETARSASGVARTCAVDRARESRGATGHGIS
jgi:hypothetical protein